MNKKIIYYSGVVIFFTLFVAGMLFGYGKSVVNQGAVATTQPTQKEEVSGVLQASSVPTTTSITESISERTGSKETTSVPQNISTDIRINFIAGDKTYAVLVPQESTVYDATAILAGTTSFRFKAKRYSGLGYFIEEINGIKNDGGAYWTLYVNGDYSTVGASQYVLKNKDTVEWKFEKR